MSSRIHALRVGLAIGVSLLMMSCAALYQPPPRRIAAKHLTCQMYPRLVDGNLATTGILKVEGVVEKDYMDSGGSGPRRYGDWLEGRFKAEAFIELESLTPVAYIAVHPISTIYRLSVDISPEAFQPGKEYLFQRVRSHKIHRSENGAVIRINIDRQVRTLRVVIAANRDSAHAQREPLTDKIKVPFQDIVIREIRVYQ